MKRTSLLASILLIAGTAWAQDPPSRVARLNLLNGPVSFQPASLDDWTAATLNYPLTTGDHLYADQGAQAEMHVGPNAIRLNQLTNFGFLNVDDRTVQLRLTQGNMGVRLRTLEDSDIWEVDTPNGAISLLRAGDYRIDTDPDRNATMVTVRSGQVEVTANGQSFSVRPGETAYFTGDGNREQIQSANPADEFDRFCADRDRREDTLPPPRYISRDMVGYEDLDANGSWTQEADYGPVWRPRTVAADWVPYRDGHWAWVEPWGWTWIDDASWGFAPFHYGRWAYIGGRWGWCPGAVYERRPVYAPALVAFVGGGSFSVSMNLGGGGVAWFPLGPREVYMPSYHHSDIYVRHVNNFNYTTVNINRVYMNQRVPGAVVAISRADFVGARPVGRAAVRVDVNTIRSARVDFAAGVAPERVSVFGRAGGAVNVPRPRDAVFNRQVVVRTAPPQAQVGFAARQQALQGNGGRPLDPQALRAIEPQGRAARPSYRSASEASSAPATGFGRPAQVQQPRPADQNTDSNFGRRQDRMNSRPPNAAPAPAAAPPAQVAPSYPNRIQERQQQQRQERINTPSAPATTAPEATPRQERMNTRPAPSAATPAPEAAPRQERRTERPALAEPRPQQQQQQERRQERPARTEVKPAEKPKREAKEVKEAEKPKN